ncbi:MAG: 23S rRNA (guanosine(2251)-2'-O)-methyltransferase RlmB [Frankia sp.]|nr:23S rRNA (guanosine(2251)-2'-O)-methyltransferase RlmB [Frankia sp.]
MASPRRVGRANIKRGGQGGRAGKAGSARKGAPVGSGGQGRDRLSGRGPTPPAEERAGHPAARAKARARRSNPATPRAGGASTGRRDPSAPESVIGRNAVVEALRAGVPATALLVASGIDHDERVTTALKLAVERGLTVRDVARNVLDRTTGGAVHQGLALTIPPYEYAHPDDLLAVAARTNAPALIVALDGVTDPHNLGAVIRSAAAFGAHGVVVPERRAAGVSAAAWKASAGAAARVRAARATNLVRALRAYRDAGLLVVGLDSDGGVTLADLEAATEPLVLVVGAEGRGVSRLVRETCDLTVRIPMAAETESLNASVAAGIALAEIARRRQGAEVPSRP